MSSDVRTVRRGEEKNKWLLSYYGSHNHGAQLGIHTCVLQHCSATNHAHVKTKRDTRSPPLHASAKVVGHDHPANVGQSYSSSRARLKFSRCGVAIGSLTG